MYLSRQGNHDARSRRRLCGIARGGAVFCFYCSGPEAILVEAILRTSARSLIEAIDCGVWRRLRCRASRVTFGSAMAMATVTRGRGSQSAVFEIGTSTLNTDGHDVGAMRVTGVLYHDNA